MEEMMMATREDLYLMWDYSTVRAWYTLHSQFLTLSEQKGDCIQLALNPRLPAQKANALPFIIRSHSYTHFLYNKQFSLYRFNAFMLNGGYNGLTRIQMKFVL